MVSLKDQLWIHDYDWESCNDRKCDKDQESYDDQKPHNSGRCESESEKTNELSLFPSSGRCERECVKTNELSLFFLLLKRKKEKQSGGTDEGGLASTFEG